MKYLSEYDDEIDDMSEINELSSYFRRMPVALYRSGPTGELLAANPALAGLLGFESVEGMKSAMTSVESVYADSDERQRWMERISLQGLVYDFDVELIRSDGTKIWVRDTARVIRDEDGEISYYEGCLIDVTDKIDAQRAKDEFIATVSHELRNPITAMLGLGQELANRYETFSDHERREMAQMIARQADDASWLIEDLLVAYRDDISRVTVSIQEFDVAKEIGRVLEVIDSTVEPQIYDGASAVQADPRRTRQILRNLVSNAERHGGEELRVQIGKVGDRIEVRVQDSGDKIPDADIDRIFKPYVRGSSPIHPKSVGLGLSVARSLARLMDGDLTYRFLEGWSTFVLSLPAA